MSIEFEFEINKDIGTSFLVFLGNDKNLLLQICQFCETSKFGWDGASQLVTIEKSI